jgi:hypothetical protein
MTLPKGGNMSVAPAGIIIHLRSVRNVMCTMLHCVYSVPTERLTNYLLFLPIY